MFVRASNTPRTAAIPHQWTLLVLLRVWLLGHAATSSRRFLPNTRSNDDTLEQPLSSGGRHHHVPARLRACTHVVHCPIAAMHINGSLSL